ncbi:MAG: class I SAM-dependent methyltransferase [Bauldia sp.]|nr:class I SAM-dependent methyltransferase [Bauldia sp.]
MDLRTTTYAGRHRHLLERLAALAPKGPLRILECGPGLAVRGLGRLSSRGVPGRPLFKGIETLVRRLPLPDGAYENYETGELLAAFGRDRVDLTLLDINPRSLAVISANLAPYRVRTVIADLADPATPLRRELEGGFDVVLALATIGRIPEPRRDAAAENLLRLTRPGGLVVEDTGRIARSDAASATEAEFVFRRAAGEVLP